MRNHPDQTFVDTLTLMIERAARIGFRGLDLLITSPAHASAADAPEVLNNDIQKQLGNGRLTILEPPPKRPSVGSPLALVPERDGGGG